MKLIIAGSRGIFDHDLMKKVFEESPFEEKGIEEVVSGCAAGVDQMGMIWAIENNIPVKRFIPDWNRRGKRASILRNMMMGDYADGLLAIWDGNSPGTKHMIDYASQKELEVFVWNVEERKKKAKEGVKGGIKI